MKMANFTFSAEDIEHVKICHTLNYKLKMIQSFPSKGYFANQVTICILNILISILTIVLNLVTIITFRSSNQLQKKMCHFLIFVQSWNDLGIGLIVSSLYSIVVVSELAGSAHCGVFFVFYVIFLTTAGFFRDHTIRYES